jgi:hypothetical protein
MPLCPHTSILSGFVILLGVVLILHNVAGRIDSWQALDPIHFAFAAKGKTGHVRLYCYEAPR